MTSIQDRHNINSSALDKWTKREQLCLASAVSCSGDQNWMTVSRSLKLLCGAHHPPDWFSQKHCAVKYGELLENVETPKRKKRTTSDSAPSIVETPTDSILRRLTEERIQELKSEIREQQETYAKLYTDVVHLQTGNSNEEQIRAMWMEIEREQEQDRQVKARSKLSAQEIQRNWRQSQFQQQQQQHHQQQQLTPLKQEQDMDIDETCKPQGTSPLLSSLLKSSSPAPTVASTTTTSTVRVNAPTITNLLTGGIASSISASSPSTKSQTSGFQNVPFSKPLTGPAPGGENAQVTAQILSPSQSAPTLSMLLEKTKPIQKSSPQHQKSGHISKLFDEIKAEPTTSLASRSVEVRSEAEQVPEDEPMEDGTLTPTKEEEQQLMEVIKNLMPENIDELADMLTSNNGILEGESILDGVDSLMNEAQEDDADDQMDTKIAEDETAETSKNVPQEVPEALVKIEDDVEIVPDLDTIKEPPLSADLTKENFQEIDSEKSRDEVEDKIETISSDDSSDNVPLAVHAKDDKSPDADVKSDSVVIEDVVTNQSPVVIDEEESETEQAVVTESPHHKPDDEVEEEDAVIDDDDVSSPKIEPETMDARKESMSDSSDVIIIPTDDESNEGKSDGEVKKSVASPVFQEDQPKFMETIAKSNEIENEASQDAITSICLPDTDEESNTFEAPSVTPKEDTSRQPGLTKKVETVVVENKPEEEVKQTLAVRKLRDRDRSESPMVEDDASDNSTTLRSRRRYSSTPVIDSIPNSPASSDDREIKVWKKPLMTVYNNLLTNKNAVIFLRPISDEQNPLFKQVCRRPMDLQIIKRHIENGTIRNVTDFQRDVFLMCQNVMIAFKRNSSYVTMARDLMQEFVLLKDQIIDAKSAEKMSLSSQYTPGVKVRGSSRKSQRLP